jgi:putative phosphoribosyl transferase
MGYSGEYITEPRVLFENRAAAGSKLASALLEYSGGKVVVLAIPNGGLPSAIQVAEALYAELDVIVCRKLYSPLNAEGGLGAVADDGTTVVNDDVVRKDGISTDQLEHEMNLVKANVRERSLLYKGSVPSPRLTGKTAIIIDDGLASGITMSVAIEAVRHRGPRQIIAAVSVASVTGYNRVETLADRVVTCAVAKISHFYLADFYKNWRDVSDQEAVHYLEQWRRRQMARG